jgi:drug/metabolite transporter (DMT)-like permease
VKRVFGPAGSARLAGELSPYAIPALAVAVGALAPAEPVSAWLVVGGAFVVLGVVLVQRRLEPNRAEELYSGPALPDGL